MVCRLKGKIMTDRYNGPTGIFEDFGEDQQSSVKRGIEQARLGQFAENPPKVEDFAEEECIVCDGHVDRDNCNICDICATQDFNSIMDEVYDGLTDDELMSEDDDEYLTEYGRNY